MRAIGAVWEKGGKAFLDGGHRYYQVSWRGSTSTFSRPGEILRWAKARRQEADDIDWAEVEIERLIKQAQQEMD